MRELNSESCRTERETKKGERRRERERDRYGSIPWSTFSASERGFRVSSSPSEIGEFRVPPCFSVSENAPSIEEWSKLLRAGPTV